jgi:hypothetical protein
MANEYRVVLHSGLSDQLKALEARANENPNGHEAREFKAALDGLRALRDGREAEYAGERLGFSPKHPDLRDCAEIKVPVVEEFNSRGRPMGPSHRVVYREYDGTAEDPRPVRQAVAYEPRKDGRPFTVAAERLQRREGVSLEELADVQNVEPMVGPGKDPRRPVGPIRRPLPPDLEGAMRAATNPTPAHTAASPPRQPPEASKNVNGPGSGRGREL